MNIAIIGTGNVGGALATRWAEKGHHIHLGVQDAANFKGKELLKNSHTTLHGISEAVSKSEVVLIATPPTAIFDILDKMGEVQHKIIIDATNVVAKYPEPYKTVYHCLADKTNAAVVKCFNTTGYENMLNPVYGNVSADMFMAGDNADAKAVAKTLALLRFCRLHRFWESRQSRIAGEICIVVDKPCIMQGMGRGMAFKLMKR